MNKRQIWLIALSIFIIILISGSIGTAVNGEHTTKNTQQIAQVEIYSATDHILIKTIKDKEALTTFNENTNFTEQWSDVDDDYMNQQEAEKYEPQYTFVSYKKSAALNSNGVLEKVLEITTFKDTNMIMMQVSPDNVKNISVSSEYLTFYFEASDEVTAYLYSLKSTNNSKPISNNKTELNRKGTEDFMYDILENRTDNLSGSVIAYIQKHFKAISPSSFEETVEKIVYEQIENVFTNINAMIGWCYLKIFQLELMSQ